MSAARHLRVWHRRISLLVGLQLLIWTASGLVFSLRPIAEIRGEHLMAPPAPPAAEVPVEAAARTFERLLERGADHGAAPASLEWRRDRWVWRLGDSLHDAASGEPLAELSEAEACAAARAAVRGAGQVRRAERIAETPARGEYRGGPAPAWRVDLDGPETVRVYLDARSGELLRLRTNGWRLYDLLWGFHIMDWTAREDFTHAWLTAAAVLALATSLTGLGLGFLVYRARWGRDVSRVGRPGIEPGTDGL